MNKKDSEVTAYKLSWRSTWLYKLEKKGKSLDQVEGPGHNSILRTHSSYMVMNKENANRRPN
jgi:hypothetical protein